ncbi:MAG: alkaline phosphatase family protein [Janthinobacterium lividum]
MKQGLPNLLCLLLLEAGSPAQAPPLRTQNVILITLDGLRWQEVFGQPPPTGPASPAAGRTPEQRRRALLPFLWDTVATRGQLYGNRTYGNQVNVANYQRYSYPGYQEILAGEADAYLLGNRPVESQRPTVLDFLSQQPAYRGRVAAFASWVTLGPILRASSGNYPVNAGWQSATGPDLSGRQCHLNAQLTRGPRPWPHVRADTLTFAYAFEYLKRQQPRVLYLSLGETDEYGHAHQYADYLQAAHRADACLAQLWAYLQRTPQYRNHNTLIFSTDHGRGRGQWWAKHNGFIPGSRQAWLAVLGPDTPPTGEQRTRGRVSQNQVAQTLAALLGLTYPAPPQAGPVIRSVLPLSSKQEMRSLLPYLTLHHD